jgi:dienelactone hydrolase
MRFVAVMAAAGSVALASSCWAAAPSAEPIEIQSGDIVLKATLFRPDGPGPFPVVVGMHGCEGLLNSAGNLSSRYRDWADRLGKAGYAVLYPDSYGSRGLGPQCRTRPAKVRTDRERVADVTAAREWLQSQDFIKADRVSLVGWDSGGISVLWVVRPRAALRDDRPDFRSAIALYPGCSRLDTTAWSARVPTLILIGSADDQASAKVCERMAAGAHGRSARAVIVVYPGAHHDFDHPSRTLQLRTGYAFSVDGSGKVHTGTNPAARADAHKRVPKWLAR